MYKHIKTAIVIPAYNEEELIAQTIEKLPDFIDVVIAVNDGSSDDTLKVLRALERTSKKLIVLDNKANSGIGFTLIKGFKYALENTSCEAIGIVAGDDQFDTKYLGPMLDDFIKYDCDYVKASRFFHREAFRTMPKYRQFGNIFISLLTKFSTGYYSITDITNGCGFLRRSILEKVNFDFVKLRYDYETSMLTALSIAGAKVRDHAVPAHYGSEKSSIKLFSTALRNIRAIWIGFWQRIYYKYILYSFHPIALSLFSGMLLGTLGMLYGLFLLYERIFRDLTPSTGSVMLVVLPLILGFQLLLTALTMDVNNEFKN